MLDTADTPESELDRLLSEIERDARVDLEAAELSATPAIFSASADIRYRGQGYELAIPLESDDGLKLLGNRFHTAHQRRFDHSHPDWQTELVTLRLRATIPVPRPQLPAAEAGGGPDAGHALLGNTTLVTDTGENSRPPSMTAKPCCPATALMAPPSWRRQTQRRSCRPTWAARVDDHLNLILERVSP